MQFIVVARNLKFWENYPKVVLTLKPRQKNAQKLI